MRCLNSGVIIGEKGEKINTLTKNLEKMLNCVVQINVVREKKEFLTAKMVALDIESQVNQRIPYKKAIKHAIDNATRLHIPGIKIYISGIRKYDMALRLKAAGFDMKKIVIEEDNEKLVDELLGVKDPVFIMPTYTAMFEIRKALQDKLNLKEFYE